MLSSNKCEREKKNILCTLLDFLRQKVNETYSGYKPDMGSVDVSIPRSYSIVALGTMNMYVHLADLASLRAARLNQNIYSMFI